MAYSKDVVRRAQQRLAQAKADRESENLQNLQTAYREIPRVKEIDGLLRRSMALAAQAVFSQGGDAKLAMEQVKQANLALQWEREQLISQHFGEGFLDESPICDLCGGNGYIGSAMCECLQELCRQEQKKEVALLASNAERFEKFRLDYYSDRVDSRYGASPRAIMERNLNICRKYAYNFGPGSGNLLFVGGTGLGKTFLSACIAAVVADRGFSVAYESSQRLFAKLEKNRFNPDDQSREQVETLENCDLLIIDDLGTEMPGNFVTAALYSLVNDRLLKGKAMIISTNLNVEEAARRYSPQIASRLQGSFKGLTFVGDDIRVMKNRG
jgi:DNA replication protein DnaC